VASLRSEEAQETDSEKPTDGQYSSDETLADRKNHPASSHRSNQTYQTLMENGAGGRDPDLQADVQNRVFFQCISYHFR
jgi:hypothetical protein